MKCLKLVFIGPFHLWGHSISTWTILPFLTTYQLPLRHFLPWTWTKIGTFLPSKGQLISKANFKVFIWTPVLCTVSLGQILEHEFCRLVCWAVKENFLKGQNFCLVCYFLGWFFHIFMGKNLIFNIFFSHCTVRTEKLHKVKLKFLFWILKKIDMNFK